MAKNTNPNRNITIGLAMFQKYKIQMEIARHNSVKEASSKAYISKNKQLNSIVARYVHY